MRSFKITAGLLAVAVALVAPLPAEAAAPVRAATIDWPIQEMERLDPLEGVWNCTGLNYSRPGATPIAATGSAAVKFSQGQRWLQWDVTTTLANGYVGTEFAVWGWDAVTKTYSLDTYGEGYRAILRSPGWQGNTIMAYGITTTASADIVKSRVSMTIEGSEAVSLQREYEVNGAFYVAVQQSCRRSS
ncbi:MULTISPECIES: DUF1579 family protein [unclassified Micromonospora]|uniref:DUF1579 family protein n=1 Tax=unclassified Micromonospora TaxID=2617518 RepID=UPI001C5F5785|nr:DUF1579 family protein [Micromonospora sp. RL09-050-HVF-A]MBW4702065.1 DUF1579 family protein [Micromonospora sp. RL09-050-HVF-A]